MTPKSEPPVQSENRCLTGISGFSEHMHQPNSTVSDDFGLFGQGLDTTSVTRPYGYVLTPLRSAE